MSGRVSLSGTATANVLVTATNRSNGGTTSVYSDSSGDYVLEFANLTNSGGTVVGYINGDTADITGRSQGYRASATVTVNTVSGPTRQNLALTASVTYTSADKVANFLQVDNFPDSASSTNPITYMRVEDIINRVEDEIDTITGHAWRAVTVTNEYHDIIGPYRWSLGLRIDLKHRSVRTMTSGTDLIEIFDGSSWVNWVATKTEGRANDFWLNYTNGVLYLKTGAFSYYTEGAKITYRYGESTVAKDIERAATLKTAIDIIANADRSLLVPMGGDGPSASQKITLWNEEFQNIMDRYMELMTVEIKI